MLLSFDMLLSLFGVVLVLLSWESVEGLEALSNSPNVTNNLRGGNQSIESLPSKNTYMHTWSTVTEVNHTCPRFVYTDITNDGLADHLERLFMILAMAYEYKELGVTVVLQHDAFSQKSIHNEHGYAKIIRELFGIPTFLNLTFVNNVYHPRFMNIGTNHEIGLYYKRQRDFSKDFPCNSLVNMDIYDMCRGFWCPFFWSGEAKHVLQPLLRQSFANQSYCRKYQNVPPLQSTSINVVWHVRTGDACLHCNDHFFYKSIHSFVDAAIKSSHMPYHNIVVYREHPTVNISSLFSSVPNITLFTSDDIAHATCLFFDTNILITTGSSFPSLVPWFSPPFHPIMIEEERKSAANQKGKYLHVSSLLDGGFHVKAGQFVANQTIDDLKAALLIQQKQ